jgi:CheY-like chemotaxis protein
MSRTPTVAVINSSEDTLELLRTCLHSHGFTSVATGQAHDIRTGQVDIAAFLGAHDPAVLIYDISIPYEDNWRFLQRLMDKPEMRGRRVVVTTTNKRVLEGLVGPACAFEIHGKPYDIEEIVRAVERAVAPGSTGSV